MKNALDTASIASLILSALVSDDAQTARDLAVAIGTTAAALRPALRRLVESADVVTSGRAGATRYVLAVVELVEPAGTTHRTMTLGDGSQVVFTRLPSAKDPIPAQPVALEVSAAVQQQRAERMSTASLVLADEEPATKPIRTRPARPVIAATVDVLGALEQTAARLAAGATLPELSARQAPPRVVIAELAAEVGTLLPEPPPTSPSSPVLRRECATPTEDVAARQLAMQESEVRAEAWDARVERQSRRQQLALSLVSAVMMLAPVAWVVAHLAR
jgi:hypothetical protein